MEAVEAVILLLSTVAFIVTDCELLVLFHVHFLDDKKVIVRTNGLYSDDTDINGRKKIIIDKFRGARLRLGLEKNNLYDEKALSKVLLKENKERGI